MHGSKALLALSILFQLVSGNQFHTLETKNEDSICFDVVVDPLNPATLDMHVEEYVPYKQFERDPVQLAVLLYRKKDVEKRRVIGGETEQFQFCGKKAVTKGLCEEKHLGKLIFNYKEGVIPSTKARGEALDRAGDYDDFYEFAETGHYCLDASSMKTRKLKILAEVKYVGGLSPDEKTKKDIDFVLLLVESIMAGAYAYSWYKWRSNGSEERSIPFVSKILILYLVLNATVSAMEIYNFIPSRTQATTIFGHVPELIQTVSRVIMRYYTYIWAAEFSPTSRPQENYLLLAFMLFTSSISDLLAVLDDSGKIVEMLHHVFNLIAFIAFCTINAKIFSRYKNRVKELKSYNKQSSPVFKQYQALIWWRFLQEIVLLIFAFCVSAILGVLKAVYDDDNNDPIMLDRTIELKLFPITELLSIVMKVYFLFRYFTPKYYESVLTYRERED